MLGMVCPSMDRRKLLTLLGGSFTVGLAGCLGNGDDDGGDGNGTDDENGDDANGGDENGGDDGNGADDGNGDDEPEPDPAEFGVSLLDLPSSILAGEGLSVGYVVENVGELEGTQEVLFTVNDETEGTEELTLGAGEDYEGEFSLAEVDLLDGLDITVATDDDEASEHVAVVDPAAETFEATSTDGFIAIGEETEEAAREEGIGLDPEEDLAGPVIIEGEIDDEENRWESIAVDFPDLNPAALLEGEDGADELRVDLDEISLLVETPDGLGGEFDQDEGIMSVEGILQIQAFIMADPEDEEAEPLVIDIDVAATTEESGEMVGEYDDSDNPVTVTVVDNTAEVRELEDPIIGSVVNTQLELPAESGDVWLEIGFDLDLD